MQQLNNNSSEILQQRVKTEDNSSGGCGFYQKRSQTSVHNSRQPNEKDVQKFVAMKLNNFREIISPGFKSGKEIKQLERERYGKVRKDSIEEREKSNEKCKQLLNEVFEKSGDDLNMKIFDKFNLSSLTKKVEKVKMPECKNLMIKYGEKILSQQNKALDPNAYLIRQQENDFKTKKLYSLNVADPKTIERMMKQYYVKSTNINYNYSNVRKPSTSLNSSRVTQNVSQSLSNSQLPYLKMFQRLKNFQKSDKKNDITQLTFITQDSPERERIQFQKFFEEKENVFDKSDVHLRNKSLNNQQFDNILKESNSKNNEEDIQHYSQQILSEFTSRINSTDCLSFREVSEQDKKRIEEVKTDTHDPRYEVFNLDNKIQGKYDKIYNYLSFKIAYADEQKASRTYKIYHNQLLKQKQKQNEMELKKKNTLEIFDQLEQKSQPQSPLNPSLMKRYKHILKSQENSPQKINLQAMSFSKNNSIELEDLSFSLVKRKNQFSEEQNALNTKDAAFEELSPRGKANYIIEQKLKELNKIDESRIKRLQRINLHKEKEKWQQFKQTELNEEQINEVIEIYNQEKQKKLEKQQKEQEKQKIQELQNENEFEEKQNIIKLKDLQNVINQIDLNQFDNYSNNKDQKLTSTIDSLPKKNILIAEQLKIDQSNSNKNSSINQSKMTKKRNISSDQFHLQNKNSSQQTQKQQQTKFNLSHLYLNKQNDEDEIKLQRQLKSKQLEENKKNGISQVVDLRTNILRIQKNIYKKKNVKLYMLSQHKLDQEFDVVCKDLQTISEKNNPLMLASTKSKQ
ncbi:hypothetical protein TTHERM_00735200 (macronuclear) [Tetrahymena thermophila SB210]|uniref:Uncharacterized protein n=1 Tax=Tetrahymena thermophila (strain SB210) TaxID=312017 RepID=Q231X6_TETTS|nr:hypothetical protein TTHERM_00735200 [Tetrahymena thermophila SB210]EAR91324.2 hypothetical protein TTHERM_00735200 [Tetrahymena thermophila SB210]|eukprot:XP_001011569.2 hypothetical protein TTHERM_00735200 [Tetrahymena thermophila SB210]